MTTTLPVVTFLLQPDERVAHIARPHLFNGVVWLLATVASAAMAATLWPILWPLSVVLLAVYILPFTRTEIAITTHRLLVRQGRFKLTTEEIMPHYLEDWHLDQNVLTTLLHCGSVILTIRKGKEVRQLRIPHVAHPIRFLRALENLRKAHGLLHPAGANPLSVQLPQ